MYSCANRHAIVYDSKDQEKPTTLSNIFMVAQPYRSATEWTLKHDSVWTSDITWNENESEDFLQ